MIPDPFAMPSLQRYQPHAHTARKQTKQLNIYSSTARITRMPEPPCYLVRMPQHSRNFSQTLLMPTTCKSSFQTQFCAIKMMILRISKIYADLSCYKSFELNYYKSEITHKVFQTYYRICESEQFCSFFAEIPKYTEILKISLFISDNT